MMLIVDLMEESSVRKNHQANGQVTAIVTEIVDEEHDVDRKSVVRERV